MCLYGLNVHENFFAFLGISGATHSFRYSFANVTMAFVQLSTLSENCIYPLYRGQGLYRCANPFADNLTINTSQFMRNNKADNPMWEKPKWEEICEKRYVRKELYGVREDIWEKFWTYLSQRVLWGFFSLDKGLWLIGHNLLQ